MQDLYRLIALAAATPAPVFISGESGTGKELVARSLHELSPRHQAPFLAVNCSAIPTTLLESEVFGHERGAFTGAVERRVGCFELASGGTLFLDEIAEMAPSTQAKFLRVLQDGTVRRVGGKTEFQEDVRLIAATNRNPAEAIQQGLLREDLLYRLNVFHLHLPPLRDRMDDLPVLIEAFLEELNTKYQKKVHGVEAETEKVLGQYAWPGNVRELRNTMERAVVVCEGAVIRRADLPPGIETAGPPPAAATIPTEIRVPIGTTVDDAERQLILATLATTGGNKVRTAEMLGMGVKTLYSKLNRYKRP